MTAAKPITRIVGQAERTLQALLHTHLDGTGIGFPEWAVLTVLNGAGPLAPDRLVSAIESGRVAGEGAAMALIESVTGAGLIAHTDRGLAVTQAGERIYLPIRDAVDATTRQLHAAIPAADLDATGRTLTTLIERAGALLAERLGPR